MSIPQAPLAGRYRFSRRVQAGTKTIAWLAIDEQTGANRVASALTAPRFSGLLRALGVKHPHLAEIVDLIKDPPADAVPSEDAPIRVAGVAIAEYVPGRTLHDELKSGALEVHDAVAIAAHVAEALAELHRAGAVHGALSPRSIVLQPEDDRASPVLTQLTAPTSGAYSAPERLKGQGPSAEDDVWALYCTLHAALVASVPFPGTTREELVSSMLAGKLRRLSEFGVQDSVLQDVLFGGLVARRMHRQSDAVQLGQLLLGWLRDNGFVERDSVVSARAKLPSIPPPTEPPVAVFEDDDDTRVLDRTAVSQLLHPPKPAGPVVPPPPRRASVLEPVLSAPRPSSSRPPSSPVAEAVPSPDADAPLPSFRLETPVHESFAEIADSSGADPFEHDEPQAPPFGPGSLAASLRDAPAWDSPPPVQSAARQHEDRDRRRQKPRDTGLLRYALVGAGIGGIVATGFVVVTRSLQQSNASHSKLAPAAANAADGKPTARTSGSTNASNGNRDQVGPLATAVTDAGSNAFSAASCAAAYFPPQTFPAANEHDKDAKHHKDAEKSRDFAFLCSDDDLRVINSELHRRLVLGGVRQLTPGMREWATLGWYELAATAVVRGGCCAGPLTIKLPKTRGPCDLRSVLERVGTHPVLPAEMSERAKLFGDEVKCLYSNGVPRPFQYGFLPSADNRLAFEGFLQRAAARNQPER